MPTAARACRSCRFRSARIAAHDFGRAEFAVSVAELGTQPATLKLLAEMLPDPDQDLSQLVIAAALAGAHLQ